MGALQWQDDLRVRFDEVIEQYRSTLHDALDGLTEEEARLRLVPSRTTLLGLVKHVTYVEGVWFDQALTGRSARQAGIPSSPDRSFQLRREDTIASVQQAHRERCARSREALAVLALDDVVTGRGERPVWALYLQVLRELAQHCGHADILREQVLARRASPPTVRPARVEDVAQMARVNVQCWQETYRGLMPDAVLDDPDLPAARERFWTAALTDERYRRNRVAVAERDGTLVGIAMSGRPLDAGAAWGRQLYVLYVRAADHGTGAGPALLGSVVDPAESVALWVADPNPRAQAFYRKHGFVADGTSQVDGGIREIRMVRAAGGQRSPSRAIGSTSSRSS